MGKDEHSSFLHGAVSQTHFSKVQKICTAPFIHSRIEHRSRGYMMLDDGAAVRRAVERAQEAAELEPTWEVHRTQ